MSFSSTLIHSKEDAFCEILYIPSHKPDLGRLLDIVVLPEALDYTTVPTTEGLSFEGDRLTGLKIIFQINFTIKISYTSIHTSPTVHSVHYNHLKTVSFNIPETSYTPDLLHLIECNQLTLSPLITSIYTKTIDCRSTYAYIKLLVHAMMY